MLKDPHVFIEVLDRLHVGVKMAMHAVAARCEPKCALLCTISLTFCVTLTTIGRGMSLQWLGLPQTTTVSQLSLRARVENFPVPGKRSKECK